MIDIGFTTGNRTPQFKDNLYILTNVEKKEGERVVETRVYNPSPADAYMLTRWMRDDELDYINEVRKENKDPVIPRYAYIGDLKYQVVFNQKERYAIEQRLFADNTPIQIPTGMVNNVRYETK